MQADMSQMPASRQEANQHLLKRSLGGTMMPSNVPAETTLWLNDEGQEKNVVITSSLAWKKTALLFSCCQTS